MSSCGAGGANGKRNRCFLSRSAGRVDFPGFPALLVGAFELSHLLSVYGHGQVDRAAAGKATYGAVDNAMMATEYASQFDVGEIDAKLLAIDGVCPDTTAKLVGNGMMYGAYIIPALVGTLVFSGALSPARLASVAGEDFNLRLSEGCGKRFG